MWLDKETGELRWSRWCQISLTAGAIVGAGALGAGASLIGSSNASSAATKSAQVQAQAADQASTNQLNEFNQVRSSLQPWITAGTGGLAGETNLLGLNPDGTVPAGGPNTAQINATLAATPGYEFTKQQGLEATQNSYAAQGLGSSGAALKGAATFATGLADQTYEQRLQDYLSLANSGQNAATGVGQLGLQATTQASNFATSGAASTAGGIVGSANAGVAGINGIANGLSTSLLGLSQGGIFGTTTVPPVVGPTNSQVIPNVVGPVDTIGLQ